MVTMIDSLAALASLLPALLLGWVRTPKCDGAFWASLALAVCGPTLLSGFHVATVWHTGLAAALWASLSATLILFLGLNLVSRQAWRLMPLLMPYLLLMALFATFWSQAPERPMVGTAPSGWIILHILVSVATYALATLASVAALAAFLQERSLKTKRPTRLTRSLPAMSESEALIFQLLMGAEMVLGIGVLSGIALNVLEKGLWLSIDHKSLLSLLAFAVIGALLIAHHSIGMRGRLAARLVLLAYLLLTLAYPGVKFVTDVLISKAA
ncbi:MAG: cytochrome c biogenesis protein CcsA [Alphaproteobacteria bacterium]|nr:cytochrome c biogenesis protein CcsA [Alphaproteobacteria bacterium]